MRHAAATRSVFLPHPRPTWITPSDQAVAARRPALARGKKWGSARIQTHAVAPLARAARKRT
jgi:hypothetical protein